MTRISSKMSKEMLLLKRMIFVENIRIKKPMPIDETKNENRR